MKVWSACNCTGSHGRLILLHVRSARHGPRHTAVTCVQLGTGGDPSDWVYAFSMPHYTAAEMPAVSAQTASQLAQWSRDKEFRFFDYGTPAANRCVAGLARLTPKAPPCRCCPSISP